MWHTQRFSAVGGGGYINNEQRWCGMITYGLRLLLGLRHVFFCLLCVFLWYTYGVRFFFWAHLHFWPLRWRSLRFAASFHVGLTLLFSTQMCVSGGCSWCGHVTRPHNVDGMWVVKSFRLSEVSIPQWYDRRACVDMLETMRKARKALCFSTLSVSNFSIVFA